jgi:hypothetical protein
MQMTTTKIITVVLQISKSDAVHLLYINQDQLGFNLLILIIIVTIIQNGVIFIHLRTLIFVDFKLEEEK